jgi:hypothetical protein
MANEFIRRMLLNQRKRVVGSIMNHAEGSFWDKLSPQERAAFRQVVLQSVGVYHDTCLDMVKSSVDDGSTIVNEEAMRMIEDIHSKVSRV